MCWARGVRRKLSRNGSYPRWVPVGQREERRAIIYRRKCGACRTSFALLPDDVLPGHRHGLERVAAGLWRGLNGDSFRSRSFFEEEIGVRQPPDDPTSWTDFLDAVSPPPRPGPSRLQGWTLWANRRAVVWLGPLAVACLAAGCQLRSDLRDVMQPLTGAPARCGALALVLGLFAWLRGTQPDLDLVKTLLPVLSRPCRRVSHNTLRAATTRSGYDATGLNLRAPPAWVRAIPPGGSRRAGLTTLQELNEFFWGWLEGTYHDRIHSELEATPRERWEAGEAGVRTLVAGDLVDTFLWEEERKVDKSGCVQLGSNLYAAGEHLVGRTVSVRFDPFDLARIRLYLGGRFIEVLEPHKLESHTYRKALPRRVEKAGPLESSRAFKEQVSKGYRREVESVLEQTRSAGVPTEACLTRVELAALLVGGLGGRHLTVAEAAQVADFFHKHAPLRGDLVRESLGRAIEEKGPNRHLRFYLDAVRRARLEGGERR